MISRGESSVEDDGDAANGAVEKWLSQVRQYRLCPSSNCCVLTVIVYSSRRQKLNTLVKKYNILGD
jgi:hypothetical protein